MMDEDDGQFEKNSRQTAQNADNKGQNHHHIPFRQLHEQSPERSQNIPYDKLLLHTGQVNHTKLTKRRYEAKNNRPEFSDRPYMYSV